MNVSYGTAPDLRAEVLKLGSTSVFSGLGSLVFAGICDAVITTRIVAGIAAPACQVRYHDGCMHKIGLTLSMSGDDSCAYGGAVG
jgi:hypothetical protein